MINELLEGKKVGALAVVTIMSGIAGTIWGGALLWNQIQDNTAKVETIQPYDDAWIKKLSDDNMNKIIALETKQSQVNFTEIMEKLSRLEATIEAMAKDIERNERTSNGSVNPLSL